VKNFLSYSQVDMRGAEHEGVQSAIFLNNQERLDYLRVEIAVAARSGL